MGRQHILIVDDDQDFATSMADLIEDEGFDITCVTSGDEAIELFDRESFDLTFMDVRMPGMNGVECLLELRKKQPDAKVVMVTGFSVESLLQQARDNGALDVIHKPVLLDHLFRVLQEINSLDETRPIDVILVVDDDDAFTSSMQELLVQQGYQVHGVGDGRAALDVVFNTKIDLVILDLRMPVLDGYDTYMALREAGQDLPILVVTAYPDEESKQLRKLLPFLKTGYMVKPVDPEKLLHKIDSALQSHQPTRP